MVSELSRKAGREKARQVPTHATLIYMILILSVGSFYANQTGKSDQTGLVPILNIW